MYDTTSITFKSAYTDSITIHINHEYYITYKPSPPVNNQFMTIRGKVVSMNPSDKTFKIFTSLADEIHTEIRMASVLSVTPIKPEANIPDNFDFIGTEICDVRTIMTIHLKYLSGDYMIDMIAGRLYDVQYVTNKNGKIELNNISGKLVKFHYSQLTETEELNKIIQARNQNPECLFVFDCSDDYQSSVVRIDIRDIRSVKEHVVIYDPTEDLPKIPDTEAYAEISIDSEPGNTIAIISDENGAYYTTILR